MYVASWSGGKDSTATIILAHENNEPLDLIIFSEVMFDKTTSGELPEHIEFVHKCIETFTEWGYKVKILHSDKTYLDCFHHKLTRGKRVGKKHGFPLVGRCLIQRDCKLKPIKQFNKEHSDAIHYVGIAIDEPKRLARLNDKTISLLAKYNYTEADAWDLCEAYGMLSPIYAFSKRGGCWFCPNARDGELRHLRHNHRELWERLLELESVPNTVGNIWNTLTKTSLHDKERQFALEDNQIKWDF